MMIVTYRNLDMSYSVPLQDAVQAFAFSHNTVLAFIGTNCLKNNSRERTNKIDRFIPTTTVE